MEDRLLLSDGPATFTVNSVLDKVDLIPGNGIVDTGTPGEIALRAAIQEANALSGPASIILPGGTYTPSIPGFGEDEAGTGDLDITDDLTIMGAGQATTIIDGGGQDRVFEVHSGATAQISGVTVRNGDPWFGSGGGILNSGQLTIRDSKITDNASHYYSGGGICSMGTLTLTESTVSSNSANDLGGGILNDGDLTITDTKIFGNSARYSGGGIRNGIRDVNDATLTMTNSTVSDNSSGGWGGGGGIFSFGELTITDSNITNNSCHIEGGGILNHRTAEIINSTVSGNVAGGHGGGISSRGTLEITNSTVSGNSATSAAGTGGGSGGGMYIVGQLMITNSTVSGNSATQSGGGIFNSGAPRMVGNTIIAGNMASTAPDLWGFIDSQGHNLVGNASGGSGFVATDLLGVDPLLGPLKDNGGPTLTHALLPGSPAIDAGDNTDAPATDQRGFARIVDGDRNGTAIVDIGAFEVAGPAELTGCNVFYNNSVFDGSDPATDERDDPAIALDKQVLLPGETAKFANYTNYSRGINGIMVDVAGLSGTLTTDDFEFRFGNNGDPDSWSTVTATPNIDVRPGKGEYGSDRVTVTWEDNVIPTRNWLEVRVKATENTGLDQDEVFYFGNAVGDADGDRVAACADMYAIYQQLGQPATVESPLDIDRDGVITQCDMDAVFPEIARLPVLNLITVPSVVATGDAAATDEDTTNVIDVLANDRDVDGNPLSVEGADDTSALDASLTVNPDGTVTYDPRDSATLQALAAGQTLDDSFTYAIMDVRGGTDTATVTVTVSGVEEPEGSGDAESFGSEAEADESVPLAMNLATGEDMVGSDQRSVLDGIFAAGGLPVQAGARDSLPAPVPWLPEEAALWFVDDWERLRGPRGKPQQVGHLPRWRPADDGAVPPAVNLKGRQNAPRMNRGFARDAVLQEPALRDSQSPETPLGESAWMWLYEFEFEQIRATKPSSNSGNLVGEAVDGLLAAGWK